MTLDLWDSCVAPRVKSRGGTNLVGKMMHLAFYMSDLVLWDIVWRKANRLEQMATELRRDQGWGQDEGVCW